MASNEGKATVYNDDRPPYEPTGTSEMEPGLGRRGNTLGSERASTGEPADESSEMPVIDSNPFRGR